MYNIFVNSNLMEGLNLKKKILLLLSTAFLLCLFCLPVGAATFTKGGAPVEGITATENKTTYDFSYSERESLGVVDKSNVYGFTVPIVVSKSGLLTIDLSVFDTGDSDTVFIDIYPDEQYQPTNSYLTSLYCDSKKTSQKVCYLPAGTYYMLFFSFGENTDTFSKVGQISVTLTTNENRSLSAGSTTNVSANANGTYIKIKPSKTGYITVDLKVGYYGYLTLCNSKKKAVSMIKYVDCYSTNKVRFAVKKNTTYYLKLQSYGKTSVTSVKYTLKAVKEKSGSKLSKAVAFKKGKTVSGVILPGDKTKDCYKITLTKPQVVKLKITGNVSSGRIKIKIYGDKNKEEEIGTKYIKGINFKNVLYSTTGYSSSKDSKWSKGTYYIEVFREDSKSNGNYSITWLK